MPFIDVKTNAALSEQTKERLKTKLGEAITAIPGKSEAWLMVRISETADMFFKGNSAECAMFEISIFGEADAREYTELTKRICDVSEKYLGVSAERVYIKYDEVANWGWNGMNF